MNIDELFERVNKIIDEPYKTQIKAIQIFLAFDEYLIDALPGYVEGEEKFDFEKYVDTVLDEIEGKWVVRKNNYDDKLK